MNGDKSEYNEELRFVWKIWPRNKGKEKMKKGTREEQGLRSAERRSFCY